jgi:hypothetical protein
MRSMNWAFVALVAVVVLALVVFASWRPGKALLGALDDDA